MSEQALRLGKFDAHISQLKMLRPELDEAETEALNSLLSALEGVHASRTPRTEWTYLYDVCEWAAEEPLNGALERFFSPVARRRFNDDVETAIADVEATFPPADLAQWRQQRIDIEAAWQKKNH